MSNILFSHEDIHFVVKETPSTLIVEVEREWADKLRPGFESLKGTHIILDDGNEQWELNKNSQVEKFVSETTGSDISKEYKLKTIPKRLPIPTGIMDSPYQPTQVRNPTKCIKDCSDKGYKVYDYSEKSIAVIPLTHQSLEVLKEGFSSIKGGKYNFNLYVNGNIGETKPERGFIVAKSNQEAMDYITQLCDDTDVRQLADFSSVKTFHKEPKIVRGPFNGGLGASPIQALNSLKAAPFPGIPSPSVVVATQPMNVRIEGIMKELAKTEKLEVSIRAAIDCPGDKIMCLWGPLDLVNQEIEKINHPNILLDLTSMGKKIVQLRYSSE